ncbi:MAG: hypothetical protein OEZ39_02085 [Gammaproteobacteria bacterium]|nr:hypothetical protein [Gammaproteobacteria bacterium]MDH5650644.1 hypothetical protein [Gammaproteobacteria bacterium]
MFADILKNSMEDKKGVLVYLRGGHSIGMVVTAIEPDHVTGRNREYDTIIVSRGDIVALTM